MADRGELELLRRLEALSMNGANLFVTVKAGAKKNSVEPIDSTHFRVTVKAPPKDGKANFAVIAALSEFLNIPKSKLTLVRGETSKHKVFSRE